MAFLVLILSILPCTDTGITTNDGKAKTEISKQGQHKNNTQQDDCSPFCSCTCCAGISLNHFIASIHFIPVYKTKPQAAHLRANVISVALPVWQPPQLI
jgi:hypothetical protein